MDSTPEQPSYPQPVSAPEPTEPESAVRKRPVSKEKKADQYRRRAADALERTARKVRELGRDSPGGDRSTRWGYQAGGGLDQAAGYMRGHSVDEISTDAQRWVKQNPGPALVCAAAVGFLAGIVLRRR